jgi:predicted pyridoxine 5'-phosphate oxidase superfamily flavin-nucleotide-binding protein
VKGAVNFIEKQPMVIVSSADENNQVWPSAIIGDYGFVTVPSPSSLSFDFKKIHSTRDDIFFSNITKISTVGTLFIELDTRRRFRINGTVLVEKDRMDLSVVESYPNCPKYIQQRVISRPQSFQPVFAQPSYGSILTGDLSQWISNADTLFVGSQGADGRMDVSHRGGPPGFVEIVDDFTLKIPDYQGNSMYNTLGNIYQNPKVGLLFIDFDGKKTLQLTGTAEILFDHRSVDDIKKTTGTGRYWLFRISKWILTSNHHDVDWKFLSYSPYNP